MQLGRAREELEGLYRQHLVLMRKRPEEKCRCPVCKADRKRGARPLDAAPAWNAQEGLA